MNIIMIETRPNYFQYVTLIDKNGKIEENNIGYSIYPHNAVQSIHLDKLEEIFPNEEFIVVSEKQCRILGRKRK